MQMTHEELVDEVMGHAGLGSPAEAERAIRAVFEVLAERVSRSEAEALADELPATLAEPLRHGHYERDFDLDELYARVAFREAVSPGFAMEHTLSTCQVVAQVVSARVLERLQRALPGAIASLFELRATASGPLPRQRVAAHRNTLAEGRPGSQRPLSDARTDGAHSQSVVCADNPHGDTKLSSSRGMTQEREHESLAEGRPGSKRPLSEGE
jgi:uncharacterized protein (DUF2267 family)